LRGFFRPSVSWYFLGVFFFLLEIEKEDPQEKGNHETKDKDKERPWEKMDCFSHGSLSLSMSFHYEPSFHHYLSINFSLFLFLLETDAGHFLSPFLWEIVRLFPKERVRNRKIMNGGS